MNSSVIYQLIQNLIGLERQRLFPTDCFVNANIHEILFALKEESGEDFSYEIKAWVDWFVNNKDFDSVEKNSLKVSYKILTIEISSLSKLKARGFE